MVIIIQQKQLKKAFPPTNVLKKSSRIIPNFKGRCHIVSMPGVNKYFFGNAHSFAAIPQRLIANPPIHGALQTTIHGVAFIKRASANQSSASSSWRSTVTNF